MCPSGLCGEDGCRPNEIWGFDAPGRWVIPAQPAFVDPDTEILYGADAGAIARVDKSGVAWTVNTGELCGTAALCQIVGIAPAPSGVRTVVYVSGNVTIGGKSVTAPAFVAIQLDAQGAINVTRTIGTKPEAPAPFDRPLFVEGDDSHVWIAAGGRPRLDLGGGVIIGDGNAKGVAFVCLTNDLSVATSGFGANMDLGAQGMYTRPTHVRSGDLAVALASNGNPTLNGQAIQVPADFGFALEVKPAIIAPNPVVIGAGTNSSFAIAAAETPGAQLVVSGGISSGSSSGTYLQSFHPSAGFPVWSRTIDEQIEIIEGFETGVTSGQSPIVVAGERNADWSLDGRTIPQGRYVIVLDPYSGAYRFHLPVTSAVSIRTVGKRLAVGELTRVALLDVPLD
jgi:hypothetical protein